MSRQLHLFAGKLFRNHTLPVYSLVYLSYMHTISGSCCWNWNNFVSNCQCILFLWCLYSVICRCAGTSSLFWVSSLLALQSVLY